MRQSASKIYVIYFFILTVEVFALYFGLQTVQFFSKPSLMLILLVYFRVKSQKYISQKNLIMLALFFSWLGDIFLLFDKQKPQLFIYGLAAFLIAHLFYIVYFYQIRAKNAVKKKINIPALSAILIYVVSLFILLAPNLGTLQSPVAVYTLALSIMLLASIHGFDFYKHDFAKLCIAGTSLFVVSDSLLAINRFYQPFAFASVLIMLTYAVAQFLITVGALKNLEYLDESKSV
ncbi:MAG: lysoplasmalogenase [Pyrinomonadaceae bacterium]